jgi:hypothetical protein
VKEKPAITQVCQQVRRHVHSGPNSTRRLPLWPSACRREYDGR